MIPDFVQAVVDTIRSEIENIHTAMPGKIVSFDSSSGTATVEPQLKYKTPEGDIIAYPQISGVPVMFPQACGQKISVAYPVKKGDGCLIIVSEKSIDFWLYGQQTDTDLSFDMTNAICIPGLFSKANNAVIDACKKNALIMKNANSEIIIKENSIDINSDAVKINGEPIQTGT